MLSGTEVHIMTVFSSLTAALHAGFHVYDRTENGYLVRTRTTHGWALALVDLRGNLRCERQ
jgi:hypothetical protein